MTANVKKTMLKLCAIIVMQLGCLSSAWNRDYQMEITIRLISVEQYKTYKIREKKKKF